MSLVISLIAVGLSGFALLRSGDDDPAAAPASSPSASSKPETQPVKPTANTVTQPSPSADSLDVLNPQATFSVAYTDQPLIPQVTRSDRAYLDLNEPRVVNSGSDKYDVSLTLYNSSVPAFVLEDGVEAALLPDGSDPRPEDCAEAIRTSPIPPNLQTAAQRNRVLCVATSLKQAARVGEPQRIVVIKVIALSDDAKVSLKLSAWGLPG